MLERYRGEDAGDLERSELDVLVGNWACLNAPGRKNWKINSRILMEEIEMDEELVQSDVMG